MTTSNASLESKALANIGNGPRNDRKVPVHFPGFIPDALATADDFEVGQLVSIYSRGLYRLAVIEKIGRKNVTCVYTTQGALTDAAKHIQRIRDRFHGIHVHLAYRRDQALRNYRFYTDEAVVDESAARFPGQYPADRIASEKAKKRDFAAEHPDADAYADAEVAVLRAEIKAAYERIQTPDPALFVTFTRKSVAFGEVGVRG